MDDKVKAANKAGRGDRLLNQLGNIDQYFSFLDSLIGVTRQRYLFSCKKKTKHLLTWGKKSLVIWMFCGTLCLALFLHLNLKLGISFVLLAEKVKCFQFGEAEFCEQM